MGVKSDYATLLNSLVEMQACPIYALRKGVLGRAEQLIVQLEQENKELRAQLATEKEKA